MGSMQWARWGSLVTSVARWAGHCLRIDNINVSSALAFPPCPGLFYAKYRGNQRQSKVQFPAAALESRGGSLHPPDPTAKPEHISPGALKMRYLPKQPHPDP